jgi:hypothetical protein
MMSLNMMEPFDDEMNNNAKIKSTILVIGILLLAFAPFAPLGQSPFTVVESA